MTFHRRFAWAVFLAFAAYYAAHTALTTVPVPPPEWIEAAPVVGEFLEGRRGTAAAMSGLPAGFEPGYRAWLLVNAKHFNLSSTAEGAVDAVAVAISLGLICWTMVRTLPTGRRSVHVIGCIAVALAAAGASRFPTTALDVQSSIGAALVLVTWSILDRVRPPAGSVASPTGAWRRWSLAAVVFAIGFGFFGTTQPLAWLLAAGCVAIVTSDGESNRVAWKAIAWIAGAIAVCLGIAALFGVSGGPDLSNVASNLAHPRATLSYWLSLIGGSALGETAWQAKFPSNPMLLRVQGVLIVAAWGVAIVSFAKTRMHRQTRLPLAMIAYAAASALTLALGRPEPFAWQPQTDYWPAPSLQLGLVGCLWIFLHQLLQPDTRFAPGDGPAMSWQEFKTPAALGLGLCILLSLIASEEQQWRQAGRLRETRWEAAQEMLDPLRRFRDPLKNVERFHRWSVQDPANLAILETHRLGIFSAHPVLMENGQPHAGVLRGTWHQPESVGSWMGREAGIRFRSGPTGHVNIVGRLHPASPETVLSITANGVAVGEFPLNTPRFEISCEVPANASVELTLRSSNVFVPRDKGVNDDPRELGILVQQITSR